MRFPFTDTFVFSFCLSNAKHRCIAIPYHFKSWKHNMVSVMSFLFIIVKYVGHLIAPQLKLLALCHKYDLTINVALYNSTQFYAKRFVFTNIRLLACASDYYMKLCKIHSHSVPELLSVYVWGRAGHGRNAPFCQLLNCEIKQD